MGFSAHKGFLTTGRDGVLVKEEHQLNWSGTNGINTTPTLTYHSSSLKSTYRMKTITNSTIASEVGFHFQASGHCSIQYQNTQAACTGTWTPSHFEYTTDGTSWTQGVMPATGDEEFNDITYWASEGKWILVGGTKIYASSTTAGALPTSSGQWSVVHTITGEELKGVGVGECIDNGVTTEYAIAVGTDGQSCYATTSSSWTNHIVYLYTGSQSQNRHNYTDVFWLDGVAILYGRGQRANRLRHATDPTVNYHATNSPTGWRSMDTSDAFGYGAYRIGELGYKNGQLYAHHQHTGFGIGSRHIARTSLAHIQARTPAWDVIENEDDAYNQTQQNVATQHPSFGALEYVNGHWFGAGVKSPNFTFNSGTGYSYSADSYDPFYCYSLDNMATFTFVYQGFSGTLMRPDHSMVVNNLFIVADTYQHTESWQTDYPLTGFGSGPPVQATHDLDKDVYSTPGITGDTVTVTFDSFFASSPITYVASPGASDAVTQDLDMFNALSKAITDGDLGGVSVTNLGSGNGIKIVNTVQGSYANPTVTGSSATCTVTTPIDN